MSAKRTDFALATVAGLLAVLPSPGATEDTWLEIELNKIESVAEGCRALFVFDNQTGAELERFRVDLILFDEAGVYSKQLLLDMAPLTRDKKVLASFRIDEQACNGIGSILINDIPQCEGTTGDALDCLDLLKVTSKSDIPLEK